MDTRKRSVEEMSPRFDLESEITKVQNDATVKGFPVLVGEIQ